MASGTKSKSKAKSGLSDRTKKTLAAAAGGLVLIACAWWGFFQFTTIAPPDLKAPGVENRVVEVAKYLGESRGFGRLNTDQKEQFLMTAYETYGDKPETRAKFIRELQQMSSSERQVLNNGIFDIGHKHVMEKAQEFANLPPSQRGAFLDKTYGDFTEMQSKLAGKGPSDSLTEPLKSDVPKNGDEMMKTIADRTNGKERSQAKPFVDAMAAKVKENQKRNKG